MKQLLTCARAYVGVLFGMVWTFLFSVISFILGGLRLQRVATVGMRFWAIVLLGAFGVSVDVEGEENLPREGGGIVVFNHQSHLDIPAIMAATKSQIRFGAKSELFRIPMFGAALTSIGTLQIARDNRSETLRIYQAAAKRFRENTIFVLAPEGTRQRQPRLGRFKKGPFLFAMNAKVPLIPVVLKGAFEVMPPHQWLINAGSWRRTIKVKFLPAIAIANHDTNTQSEALAKMVNEAFVKMNDVFEALPPVS